MKSRLLITGKFVLLIMMIMGCSHKQGADVKETPPLKASLIYQDRDFAKRVNVPITAELRLSEDQSRNVKVKIEASGVVQVQGQTSYKYELAPNEVTKIPFQLNMKGYGVGMLRVKIDVYDNNNQHLYGNYPTRFVLSTAEEVLVGTQGYDQLRLQHLEHLLKWGKINHQQYEKEKKKIKSGMIENQETL
jgi:hypothetical protein